MTRSKQVWITINTTASIVLGRDFKLCNYVGAERIRCVFENNLSYKHSKNVYAADPITQEPSSKPKEGLEVEAPTPVSRGIDLPSADVQQSAPAPMESDQNAVDIGAASWHSACRQKS